MPHHQTGLEFDHQAKGKPKPGLLHFGLDYLVLLIGVGDDPAPSVSLLEAIFSIPHNDSNASEVRSFVWNDDGDEVILRFGKYQYDEIAYVSRGEDLLFSIQEIGPKSTMPSLVRLKYKYRISFYGWFFGLVRLGEFDLTDFWGIFLRDIEDAVIGHSVSRIDICADIANVSVGSVERGIVRLSERIKRISKFNIDPDTKEPETVYFGEKSNHWKGRIYNKLLEVESKGKERLHADYFQHEKVTRVEIELHSRSCKTFGVNLESVQGLEFLLSVYAAHLKNKSASWRILRVIEREMKKRGFRSIPTVRKSDSYDQMSNRKFFRATFRKNIECAKRYGEEFATIQDWMSRMYRSSRND